MATLNFNANTVEPSSDFEAIPPGKYLAAITESEMKPTRSAQGQYLQLTFQLLDGPYKGRYLWARLNLQNPNPTTVQIARGELSAICRACGVMTPGDDTPGQRGAAQHSFGRPRQGQEAVNHYFRVFRGRTVISRRGRAFRQAVSSILAAAGVRPMAGRLCVSADLYPPGSPAPRCGQHAQGAARRPGARRCLRR